MGDSLFYMPSGRLSGRQADGAAMSYTYDGLGRLTFCEAGMVADPSTDYSTSYTYDLNSNITSLRRAGAIDRVGSTIETGYHSEAEFELEGNRISWGTLWSVANTFEGATGILQDDAEVYHEYDPQGRLTASNTDQIAEIEYNHLSQPVRVKFFDGKEQCSVYDNAGQLIKRYTRPGGGRADRIDQVFIGPYEFGANRSLKKIHFAGGYFTADGKVHYHITDYQGSVGAVIRGDGVVEQRTHYYPYGEPWLEPEGDNRRLHTGKERLRWGSTPVHDFGARILPPAIPFWTTPDPCAERYYHLGPYTFCAADPINHSDPNGKRITTKLKIGSCVTIELEFENHDGEWGFYFLGLFKIETNFTNTLTEALKKLQDGPVGKKLVDRIVNSDQKIEIKKYTKKDDYDKKLKSASHNSYKAGSKKIIWDPNYQLQNVTVGKDNVPTKTNTDPFIALGHEMEHAEDDLSGNLSNESTDNIHGAAINANSEKRAVTVENFIRHEHGLDYRVGYGMPNPNYTWFPDFNDNINIFSNPQSIENLFSR